MHEFARGSANMWTASKFYIDALLQFYKDVYPVVKQFFLLSVLK